MEVYTMRTEMIEKKYYKFDELSDEAREHVYDHFREFNAQDMLGSKENEDSLKAFEKIFPIKVADWQYGDQNFINFRMEVDYDEIEELTGWRLVSYLWNNYREKIFKGKYYSTPGTYTDVVKNADGSIANYKYHYKHRHSKIIFDNCCVLTGYYMDDDLLSEIYAYMNKPDSRTFKELLNDCLYNWVHACQEEMEYQDSPEAIKETIEANDYEFDEEGNLQ